MRKSLISCLAAIVMILPAGVLTALPALADDPEARAIMEKVDARDDGDNQVSDMEMILVDKRGKKRIVQNLVL